MVSVEILKPLVVLITINLLKLKNNFQKTAKHPTKCQNNTK
jgi:hypothetical protein